jgi:hypothetical protein
LARLVFSDIDLSMSDPAPAEERPLTILESALRHDRAALAAAGLWLLIRV